MKIAIVAASPRILGGHSVQAAALAAGLCEGGDHVSWIPIDPLFPRGLRPIRRWPYVRTLVNQVFYLASLFRLRSADVVHVFSASYWSFLLAPAPAILAAKLFRKPVVLHYHSGEAPDHFRRWRHFVIPFLGLADEIVVPSNWLKDVFASYGFEARVIPNVVAVSHFRDRERGPLTPALLSVRNLERHYRVDVTIEAFARIKERIPAATLTVVGYGSEERNLRAFAERLGVDGIRFLGRIEPESLPAIYDAADLFLNASTIDNQPVSILEAFASGLPVVSTPTGDIATMLRGGGAGILIPPEDPEAMADAALRLLADRELAARITGAARAELRKYTWPRIREQWRTVYTHVLDRAAAPRRRETVARSLSPHA